MSTIIKNITLSLLMLIGTAATVSASEEMLGGNQSDAVLRATVVKISSAIAAKEINAGDNPDEDTPFANTIYSEEVCDALEAKGIQGIRHVDIFNTYEKLRALFVSLTEWDDEIISSAIAQIKKGIADGLIKAEDYPGEETDFSKQFHTDNLEMEIAKRGCQGFLTPDGPYNSWKSLIPLFQSMIK